MYKHRCVMYIYIYIYIYTYLPPSSETCRRESWRYLFDSASAHHLITFDGVNFARRSTPGQDRRGEQRIRQGRIGQDRIRLVIPTKIA